MDKYFCFQDSIDHLKERGFVNDFILFGDDLLWIQQKIFIRSKDFSILECHQLGHPGGHIEDLIVFGVLVIPDNSKGLLINHYSHASGISASMISKLNKIKFYNLEGRQS